MENPAAYIPLDRRRALAAGVELPTHTTGAALFADISGFTPLAEALALAFGPRRGADELTRQLNEVYNAIIAPIHRYDGAVIGFSGDAITCWFDDRETTPGSLRACAAGLEIQQAMSAFARLDYPSGPVRLAIKIAVAAGPVQRYLVGDPASRLIDVLAGGVLERMAATESVAEQGEVLMDETSARGQNTHLAGGWIERSGSRVFRVDGVVAPVSVGVAQPDVRLADEVTRPWLLPGVYERIRGQQGRFLAELRPAAALFLKFDGLDFDANPEAGEQLDRYIRWVQGVLDRLEGSLIQLTTGDKGSYLYAAFGAPVAHDDDAQRVITAALELSHATRLFPCISRVAIGISQGRMRVGAYGSENRRTYGVLGDETNLAARLMSKAEAGQILVSQRVAEQIGERFQLRAMGAMRFKGKSEPMPVFAVEGERIFSGDEYRLLFPNRLEGRDGELARMHEVLADVLDGRGALLRVQGEAGVGKSHLAALFLEEAQQLGAQIAVGSCQSTGQGVAYGSVGAIARQLVGLVGQEGRSLDEQLAHLTAVISGLNPEWLVRLPLLGDLLRLPIPDNPTTAAFTPQLRQEALIALALEIVQLRARQRPLLLLIEDIHWIDEASGQLVLALSRVIRESGILLLLTHRPLTAEGSGLAVGELVNGTDHPLIELAELPPEGVAGLVSNRLGGPVDDLALALIQVQAQGNAFFTEELVDALAESGLLVQAGEEWGLSRGLLAQLQADGCVQRSDGRWRLLADAPLSAVSLGMPDTIHGVVLSRLDRLPEDVKLTLKLASVIGRVFEFDLLAAIHPAAHTPEELTEQINTLSRRDFARLERPQPQITYIFKHNITQEVVYKTLLESQQREVHTNVAQRLESIDPQAIERLAFHYRHGDTSQPPVRSKALHYLDAAGIRAKREFANETALGYVERALGLSSSWERQTAKVDLLHILGRREEEQAALDRLDGLAGVPPLEVQLLWGQFHESMSDYPAALAAMEDAAASARAADDSRGVIRVLGRIGLIHWRQGNYSESAAAYDQALTLLADAPDWAAEEAEIRYGLGILHRQQGKFAEAQAELERALALARQLENRQEEAKVLAALASIAELHRNDYPASQAYNLQALGLRRQIGDRAGEGASLLALGQSYSRLGQYSEALASFTEALAIQQAVGNRWWEAIAWMETGIVDYLVGRHSDSYRALTTALNIFAEIEADAGVAYAQANLGQALREMGEFQSAKDVLQASLASAQHQNDVQLKAICHSEIAFLALVEGDYATTEEHAVASLALFNEIGTPYSTTADLAFLALAMLHQERNDSALDYARRAFELLEESAGDGPDFPHRDYRYCAQVFRISGYPKDAEHAQATARRLLQEKAARISDSEMRMSFLENVSFNREIWATRM